MFNSEICFLLLLCCSETLEEIKVQFREDGQRAVERAALQLQGQALMEFKKVVENHVESAISAQEARFGNHQWSKRLRLEEAAMVCTYFHLNVKHGIEIIEIPFVFCFIVNDVSAS